jgi:hypothetical protein
MSAETNNPNLVNETEQYLAGFPILVEMESSIAGMLNDSISMYDGVMNVAANMQFLIPIAIGLALSRDTSLNGFADRLGNMHRIAFAMARSAVPMNDEMIAELRRWPAMLAVDIEAAIEARG